MAEPSDVNSSSEVSLFGGSRHSEWKTLAEWRKDHWPMKFFQYGNASLPDGENSTDLLAATTVAVRSADLQTTIWRITSS